MSYFQQAANTAPQCPADLWRLQPRWGGGDKSYQLVLIHLHPVLTVLLVSFISLQPTLQAAHCSKVDLFDAELDLKTTSAAADMSNTCFPVAVDACGELPA